MIIGLLEARISLPDSHSLKDKRSVLRSVKDRIRNEFNVSVAEVGDQDLWQSAELAFVTVAATKDVVEGRLSQLMEFLRSTTRYVLLDMQTQYL